MGYSGPISYDLSESHKIHSNYAPLVAAGGRRPLNLPDPVDDGLGAFELAGYLLERRPLVDHFGDLPPQLEGPSVGVVAEVALAGAGRQVAAGQVVGVNAVRVPVEGSGP